MLKRVIGIFAIAATTTTMTFSMSLSKLNSASKDELMEISGIGKIKAAAIIKERKKGKFKSFEDLSSRVEGIGKKMVINIKDDIKVSKKSKKSTAKKSSRKSSADKETKSKYKTSKKLDMKNEKSKKLEKSKKTKKAA